MPLPVPVRGQIRAVLSFQERYGQPRPCQMNLRGGSPLALVCFRPASDLIRPRADLTQPPKLYATIKVLKRPGVGTVTDPQQKGVSA